MKTLILVRHAKSSWANPGLSDFDRPLNDRGLNDAPVMARRLKNQGITIEEYVSSPAKRAKKTAKLFCEEAGAKKEDIIYVDELYHASPQTFTQVVNNMPSKKDAVALFSHNDGITWFANSLTRVQIDNMPTCGIFVVKADVADWKDFMAAPKEFVLFDYPKNTGQN